MAKFQSPLLGYNNNVRHKNRQFHIQTEDSGVNHPHIITHLFMDGGRILKSVKKSYAEHVGAEGMSETVRGLMKEQHKAMFIALRDGQFDHLVDPGAAAAAAAAKESAAAVPAEPAVDAVDAVAAVDAVEAPAIAFPEAARIDVDASVELSPNTIDETKRPARVEHASSPPPASAAHAKSPHIVDVPPPPSARPPDLQESPMTMREAPSVRPDAIAASAAAPEPAKPRHKSPSGRELTLDFDALERAAHEAVSPSLFHSADLPPPPKNLFAKEPGTGGKYRAVEADPRHDARQDPREERSDPRVDPREEPGPRTGGNRIPAPPPSTRGDKSPKPGRTSTRAPEARYAPARPAAIFGSTQRPPPSSLFNDELVSDKSLDEVILSYLAEDLEPPRRK